jgi:hypothetical protein
MQRDLSALRSQGFDLLVVGGGITCAGAASSAAVRGLRAVSREECIDASPSGIRSVAGGKFPTSRLTAGRLIDRMRRRPCRTHRERPPDVGAARADGVAARARDAVEREMTPTVADVPRRRPPLALGPGRGMAESTTVADGMGGLLGPEAGERRRQLDARAASVQHIDGTRAPAG